MWCAHILTLLTCVRVLSEIARFEPMEMGHVIHARAAAPTEEEHGNTRKSIKMKPTDCCRCRRARSARRRSFVGLNGNAQGSDNGSMKGLRTYRDRVAATVESAIYGVILSGMKGVWGPPN